MTTIETLFNHYINSNTKNLWGTVTTPKELSVNQNRVLEGDVIREQFTFTNTLDVDFFVKLGDISIATPVNDKYDLAEVCLDNACHAHLFMGGNVSYIKTSNMNNIGPHLGLILTKGSLGAYSIDRFTNFEPGNQEAFEMGSGDRGDFLLHPSAFALRPQESYTIEWVLFPHKDEDDFYVKAAQYTKFIHVHLENWISFVGENMHMVIEPTYEYDPNNVSVKLNGSEIAYVFTDKNITLNYQPTKYGELVFDIVIDGIAIKAVALAQIEFDTLIKKRCEFICDKQQYHNPDSQLNNAFLIYDNDTKDLYFNPDTHDHNAVRERMVMGMLLATYLQQHNDRGMRASLKKYLDFLIEKRFDQNTGKVMNDWTAMKARDRKYNYPWFIQLMIEAYKVYNDTTLLDHALKAIRYFYTVVNAHEFCAPTLFIVEIINTFKAAGMMAAADEALKYFVKLADEIAENGIYYPKHEVQYENGIVAPGTHIELQVYKLTNDESYLNSAKTQLNLLEIFAGHQPNYHLYETSIRHWDGFWFGKCRSYGDTFPHYWSAENGIAYKYYYEQSGEILYKKKFKDSLRGCLSLFYPDGSATCAYMFPHKINGVPMHKADRWANDQDFAMYYYAKFIHFDERYKQ